MKNYINFGVFVFAWLLFFAFAQEVHFQTPNPEISDIENSKRLASETSNSLPQSPVVAKLKSDLQDRNLKGKVKFVHTEIKDYAEKNSSLQRKSQKYEEFNEAGNLVKEIEYNDSGDPIVIYLYGYISGKRVALSMGVPNENSLITTDAENSKSLKSGNRYTLSFKYKYLNGKLVEEILNSNNGLLSSRVRYRYLKNVKESYYYDSENWLWRKSAETLDDKGNAIKTVEYEPDEGKLIEQFPFIIKYESFDSQGNWTKRTTSRLLDVGEKEKLIPENVEYRTLSYY